MHCNTVAAKNSRAIFLSENDLLNELKILKNRSGSINKKVIKDRNKKFFIILEKLKGMKHILFMITVQ